MKNYPINDIEDENYCPEILIHPERLEKLEAKLADKEKQLAEARAALETAESEIRGAIKLCGEYAISAKEGLHASLALSIGRLKYQLECELAHKKKLSDCANSGIIANESLLGQLAEARAEIEKNSKLIERMKNCQNCGRTGGFCRHCRYAPDKRGWDDNWKEPI